MKGTIRKIIVGDNYNFCIKYVKGSEYRIGHRVCTLVDFQKEEGSESIDILVNDSKSTFLWKTINSKPLEIEYDANFE